MNSTSGPFQFNTTDLWKSVRTTLLGLGAVLVTATAAWATSTDFGPWSFIITPLVLGVVDAARRWLTNYGASP